MANNNSEFLANELASGTSLICPASTAEVRGIFDEIYELKKYPRFFQRVIQTFRRILRFE